MCTDILPIALLHESKIIPYDPRHPGKRVSAYPGPMLYFYFTGSRIFSLTYRKNSGKTLLLHGGVTPESASAIIRGPCFMLFFGMTATSFTHATKPLPIDIALSTPKPSRQGGIKAGPAQSDNLRARASVDEPNSVFTQVKI